VNVAKMQQPVVWQDSEIRFNAALNDLEPRRGEDVIDSINSVEDTKGNNGERGALCVTNLRIVWICHKRHAVNLSIGYNSILSLSIRKAKSRLRGTHQALYVMAKFGNTRYEFIFTSLVKNSPRLFTTCQSVFRAYETSKVYRNVKLRYSLIKDGKLITLPQEEIMNVVQGVWNLSFEQGNLGILVITNVRVVWFSSLAHNYNVSVPYMQISSISTKISNKFGEALVIQTLSRAGGYMLGFRVEPQSQLQIVVRELVAMFQVGATNPVFGVQFELEEKPAPLDAVSATRVVDDVEIVDGDTIAPVNLPSYLAEANKEQDRDVVFDEHLGLAIESMLDESWDTTQLFHVVHDE